MQLLLLHLKFFFNAVMTFGTIFWGISFHSIQVFRMQKKSKYYYNYYGNGNRKSCRNLFKGLKILLLVSQYILSLHSFVSYNREQYFKNSEIHNINTGHTSNLHPPRAHLNIYQKESLLFW